MPNFGILNLQRGFFLLWNHHHDIAQTKQIFLCLCLGKEMIQLRGSLANPTHRGQGAFPTFSTTSKYKILQILMTPLPDYWEMTASTWRHRCFYFRGKIQFKDLGMERKFKALKSNTQKIISPSGVFYPYPTKTLPYLSKLKWQINGIASWRRNHKES